MKKRFWLSFAIGINCLTIFGSGDIALTLKAGMLQREGVYKECYGGTAFHFGGIIGYEAIHFYRSKVILEMDCNFAKGSEEVEIAHIAGVYNYNRSLKRTGVALRMRYEYNFTKDGISFAAGVQRDFEKEKLDGFEWRRNFWRPTVSMRYELNLSKNGEKRMLIGTCLKFSVDKHVEVELLVGLKISFTLFQKFGG